MVPSINASERRIFWSYLPWNFAVLYLITNELVILLLPIFFLLNIIQRNSFQLLLIVIFLESCASF